MRNLMHATTAHASSNSSSNRQQQRVTYLTVSDLRSRNAIWPPCSAYASLLLAVGVGSNAPCSAFQLPSSVSCLTSSSGAALLPAAVSCSSFRPNSWPSQRSTSAGWLLPLLLPLPSLPPPACWLDHLAACAAFRLLLRLLRLLWRCCEEATSSGRLRAGGRAAVRAERSAAVGWAALKPQNSAHCAPAERCSCAESSSQRLGGQPPRCRQQHKA